MKNKKVFKQYRLLLLGALLLLLTAAACVPPRIGVKWAAVDTILVNGEEKIIVSYTNQIAIVDPGTGSLDALLNSNGEPRVDADGRRRTWVLDGAAYNNAQFFVNPIVDVEAKKLLTFDYQNQRFMEIDLVRAEPTNTAGSTLAGHVLSDFLQDGSRYYVTTQDGRVLAIDRADFNIGSPVGDEAIVWRFSAEESVWAPPVLEGDTLYVSSLDHFLYALDIESGDVNWSLDLQGGITSAPLYHDGHLYIGNIAHKVYDISSSGEILAEFDTENWVWSTPVLHNNVLYAADLSGYVYALDPTNNLSLIWSAAVGEKGIGSSPLVTDEYVIVASRDGMVYWLDPTDGTKVNELEIDGRPEILSDMLLLEPSETMDITDSQIIISTINTSHMLVAISLDGDRVLWTYAR